MGNAFLRASMAWLNPFAIPPPSLAPPPPAPAEPTAPAPATAPAGGATDHGYAAHYADQAANPDEMTARIMSLWFGDDDQPAGEHKPEAAASPRPIEGPEKPEGPEVHSFDMEAFPGMKAPAPAPVAPGPVAVVAPPPPTVADWTDPTGGARSRRLPAPTAPSAPAAAPAPAPAPPADVSAWQDAARTRTPTPAAHGRCAVGRRAPPPPPPPRRHRRPPAASASTSARTAAPRRYFKQKQEGTSTVQTGVGVDMRGNTSVAQRTVDKVDAEGHVEDGHAASAGIGPAGMTGSLSGTHDGKTTAAAVQLTPHQQSVALTHGDEEHQRSLKISHSDGTTAINTGFKNGSTTTQVGASFTDQVTRGKIGEEGVDASIHDFIGEGTYVEHDSGHSESLGVDVGTPVFGAGGSGYVASMDKVKHFTAGKDDPNAASAAPTFGDPQLPPELAGVDRVADVDIDKLKPGEGYSIEHSKGKGIEGHLKVGVTASLGHDDAEMAQAVLARDANGDIRVMLAEGDSDALTKSVSASNVASFSQKDSEAASASVAFTAHGKEGEQAVKEFQQTGLLPGADQVARAAAPEALAAFEAAKARWQQATQAAVGLAGEQALAARAAIEELRAAMSGAAGTVNQAFLQHRGGSLDDAGVPGVTYDDHTIVQQQATDSSAALFGLSLFHSGSEQTEYEDAYRAGGEQHVAEGYARKDSYVFSKSEDSNIIMDPKGYAKEGDPVAMAIGSRQGMNQHQRDVMAKLGPGAFDMPPETLEAWRNGSMNESELANVAVTMTDSQLRKVRDTIAKPNDMDTDILKSGAGALYDEGQSSAALMRLQMAAGHVEWATKKPSTRSNETVSWRSSTMTPPRRAPSRS